MKANEAPEKIYIFENPILDFTKLSIKQSDNDIEYIRKDAFIKMACEWLKDFCNEHYIMSYSDSSEIVINELIEIFKNKTED